MSASVYQVSTTALTQHRDQILRAVWQAMLDAGAIVKSQGPLEGWTISVSDEAIGFTKPDPNAGVIDPEGDGLLQAVRARSDPEEADGPVAALAGQLTAMLNVVDLDEDVFPRQP
jgi:hypothetical protein